jgi:protein-tyrosine phosphatase
MAGLLVLPPASSEEALVNILFVCTGNTCRSPMAEHLFRKMLKEAGRPDVTVVSAGVMPSYHLSFPAEARTALAKEGVSEIVHAPKPVTRELVGAADQIWVMEKHHQRALASAFPEAANKIRLLKENGDAGIPDPIGGTQDIYQETLDEIKESLRALMSQI